MDSAVAWMTTPKRPKELLPLSRDTRSAGSSVCSVVEPKMNSPGYGMKVSGSEIWTGLAGPAAAFGMSLTECRELAKAGRNLPDAGLRWLEVDRIQEPDD